MIKELVEKFSKDLQQHTLPAMLLNNIIIHVKENNKHIKRYGFRKKVNIHCDLFKRKNLYYIYKVVYLDNALNRR